MGQWLLTVKDQHRQQRDPGYHPYDWDMDASTERIPVETLYDRASRDRPGRMLVTAIAACFLAIGWGIGRFFHALGCLIGRVWLVAAFCGEAVVYGFQLGAKVPSKPLDSPGSPQQ